MKLNNVLIKVILILPAMIQAILQVLLLPKYLLKVPMNALNKVKIAKNDGKKLKNE